MSKTYTASVLRRSASPRSNKLKTSATAASSSSYLSSVLINPAGSNDSVFWKYFGLDEDGGLYVKKTDAGEARNFWTYGQLAGGGIIDNDSGAGGSGGVRNLWALDDVKKANGAIVRQDDMPVNDGDILVYGTIGTDEQDRPIKGWYAKPENAVGGGGTVTSIGLSAGTGLVIGGSQSPITSSGAFTVGIASGYKLPTSEEWAGKQNVISDLSTIRSNASNGQAAYNWGDHSVEGYLKSITGAMVIAALSFSPASQSALDAIDAKIPGAASSSNQLADKAFVNSSIATASATFRGTSAAGLTESQFLSWANGLTHDTNDYVFWRTSDSAGNTVYKRYKYTGSAWSYEYDLNNSSFTSAQWSAINSGITSSKVTSYDSHVGNGDVHVTTSQKSSWTAKQDAISDLSTIRSNASNGQAAYMWGDHSSEGYLKAITSAMVVAALGYTPYNATNPNGYTNNAGTVTGIKMNGGSAISPVNGIVDLGTILNAHQQINIVAAGQSGTANTTVSNGYLYLNLVARNSSSDSWTKKGGVKITGSNNVKVESNTAGIISISGPEYVPTTSGTDGYILVAGGGYNAPTWQSEVFIDKTNSRVGIGTTSPSYPLHVVGVSYFNGNVMIPTGSRIGFDNIQTASIYRDSNGHFNFETDYYDIVLNATYGGGIQVYADDGIYVGADMGIDANLNVSETLTVGDVDSDLNPHTSATHSLGSSSYVWDNLYTNYVKIGPATIYYDSTNKCLRVIGTDNGVNIGFCCDGQLAGGGIMSNS